MDITNEDDVVSGVGQIKREPGVTGHFKPD